MLQLTTQPDMARQQVDPKRGGKDIRNSTLWKARRPPKEGDLFLTALLPLELNMIIAGYSVSAFLRLARWQWFNNALRILGDGYIKRSSLAELAVDWLSSALKHSDVPLNASVTSLFIVDNRRTSSRIILGGGDDGSVACWDFR